MKGNITISRPSYGDGRENIVISIRDRDSGERFCEVNIDYKSFTKLITGQSEIDCELNVKNLERVGKKRENDTINFPFDETYSNERNELASEKAKEYTPEGWTCDNYFGSQTSFFRKDGVDYARATIRRWIDKE